jgi:ferritin-like metal-binding protein YciE
MAFKQGDRKMGLFSKDIENLNDLFVHQLQDVYYAENQILRNLQGMIEKVSNARLKKAFEVHLEETREHVRRIQQVFQMEGIEPEEVGCPAIDGILTEAEFAAQVVDSSVLDAALAAAAQSVEHYEIARYGTLIGWAKRLGRDASAAILSQTLEEEKAADRKLTELMKSAINLQVA